MHTKATGVKILLCQSIKAYLFNRLSNNSSTLFGHYLLYVNKESDYPLGKTTEWCLHHQKSPFYLQIFSDNLFPEDAQCMAYLCVAS